MLTRLLIVSVMVCFCVSGSAPPAVGADNPACGPLSEWGGVCPRASALATGNAIEINAQQQQSTAKGGSGEGSGSGGSGGGTGSGSGWGDGDGGGGTGRYVVPSVKGNYPGAGLFELTPDRWARLCPDGSICQPVPPVPAVPGEPAAALVVTVRDLINFSPAVATQTMQPAKWIAVGLPTNFIGTASAHIEEGDLLGYPAQVRFTPTSFTWNYGDGSTGSGTGATWEALGVPEFSDTTTSHVYAAAGPYNITLTVGYTAEYRFAGSTWQPVVGVVSSTSPPLAAPASVVRTVLVAEDCLRNPSGVGCP